MRRRVLTAAIVLAAGYAALCALAFFAQRSLLFPAPGLQRQPRASGATLLTLSGPRGPVFALHVPAPSGARTAVFFHGNGEDLADAHFLIDPLRAAGLGVLAVEYPGYGLARGQTLSEAALYDAAETAVRFVEASHAKVALLGAQ